MYRALFTTLLFVGGIALAGISLVDYWASALGGRDKIAAIKSAYREASAQAGPYQ